MPHAIVATTERLTHQIYWGKEFGAGLQKHGWTVELISKPSNLTTFRRCDLLVLWGIRSQDAIKRQKGNSCEVCIIERGYILDRFAWSSVSFGGGLNGRGKYRPITDPNRWEKHFSHLMKDWIERPEGYALIMGQVPGDTAVLNVNMPAFYKRAAEAFGAKGIATRFREHPRFHSKPRPLADDLAGARCVVTWNSNSGVDAVLAGIPTVAMDIGSMAWEVAGHELELPPTPDRTAWAHALAWKQWSLEEMTSGYCWDHVKGDP